MTPNSNKDSTEGKKPQANVRDIEDVFKESKLDDQIATVKIHTRRRATKEDVPENEVAEVESNDINPQSHKIFMRTWGCSHNTSDSEYMAGLLTQHGFRISANKQEANVWILNSCTVKGPSEQHFKNEVEEGRSLNKKVIVSGCVPQSDPRSDYIKGLSIIGVKQIDEIVTVVEEVLKGNSIRLLSFKKKNGVKNPPGASLHFPKIRKNELIEIIPVSTGCLNSCTYCKTKLARGNLSSYPIDEIVSRAEQVIQNEGVREIWLTSEDLGAWGIDLGLTIVDLLPLLVKSIPPNCMLRLGMTNPPYILDHLEEISSILNHPQVYGFLHIPIQAASDSVLLEMKREYTSKQFEHIVQYLRERVPSLTIATDIICGFPTETEQDFEETYALVKKHKFSVLYINQFYPRPGTQAAKLPRIPTHIVKQRTKRLTNLFLSYTPYDDSRIGQIYRNVLVTEISHDNLHLVGHNKAYEQILIKKEHSSTMGKKIDVRIIGVSKFAMFAVPLEKKNNNSFLFYSTIIIIIIIAVLLLKQ